VPENLPDPRKDGMCCDCEKKFAETNDGRFCRGCLRRRIASITPMVGCFRGQNRTADHKENTRETKHGRDR
jgi:hypothetical protein